MLIRDTAQRIRTAAPTTYGMHPAIAERLQSFGVDPRALADRIRETSSSPRRRVPPPSSRPLVREMHLDHTDVTQRELLQQTAMESYDPDFIGEEIAPTAFVDLTKGTYSVLNATQERREVDDRATSLAKPNELQSSVSLVNFDLVPRALEDYQARKDAAIAPGIASFAKTVERLAVKMKRQAEIRIARAVLNTANYAAANVRALGAGYQWNGGPSADPITDIQTILAAMGAPPTHVVTSFEAWQAVQVNDDLRAILASQMSNKGMLTQADFGLYFGVPEVIIDSQRYTPIGTDTDTRLYDSDKIAFVHVSADPEMRTFLRRFVLRGGNGGYYTLTWFDPKYGQRGVDWAKVSIDDGLAVVDNTYGGLITGVRQ